MYWGLACWSGQTNPTADYLFLKSTPPHIWFLQRKCIYRDPQATQYGFALEGLCTNGLKV